MNRFLTSKEYKENKTSVIDRKTKLIILNHSGTGATGRNQLSGSNQAGLWVVTSKGLFYDEKCVKMYLNQRFQFVTYHMGYSPLNKIHSQHVGTSFLLKHTRIDNIETEKRQQHLLMLFGTKNEQNFYYLRLSTTTLKIIIILKY
ncbi:hypothetical protein CWI38_0147p0010 [Hamiltosporidium tvaerminnensis]|uniref:Uncharacterized protein n=1 Tax=Hamiltosporidium tvaerminnensis TaxID=1176355 RepID=A0A4Q9M0D3_9MICR|nr:hypothetical protein CWI38_0147p0010 [Hamiltosporidium tvaerminnensis]